MHPLGFLLEGLQLTLFADPHVYVEGVGASAVAGPAGGVAGYRLTMLGEPALSGAEGALCHRCKMADRGAGALGATIIGRPSLGLIVGIWRMVSSKSSGSESVKRRAG